ncbi:glycerate kinase family protein [Paludisphaera rhizosphaerae]|uniref:glycerate kinase family protein n=1 Tax=Paludisphaera rhizosphaerae TaxID=2711216 RepID=UPI0013ED476C|nr:glycerate kinase [Paludisphaera rhizosphaerae]
MRFLIAPDKFKGSLTASQAVEAIARGVRSADPSAEIVSVPMADGGEGVVEALVTATQGEFRVTRVTGPLGEPVQARYGLLGDGHTAVVEMAQAAGLVLVPKERRDPGKTTTRGVGELIREAVKTGARRIIVGIGGSATNDGGAGMAQALGYRLLDAQGREIGPGSGALADLDRIEPGDGAKALEGIEVAVACDVTNPLCGPKGASAVYGPQKGATPEMVARLDANLARLAEVVARDLGPRIADLPGSGAAGGLGGGLVAFAGGKLGPGIDLVVEAVGLNEAMQQTDLCLTGEGSLDAQSAFGKTAVGVARVARRHGVPCFALVGSIGEGAAECLDAGLTAYFPILPGPMDLDDAMARASELLGAAAEQVARGFLAGARAASRRSAGCE